MLYLVFFILCKRVLKMHKGAEFSTLCRLLNSAGCRGCWISFWNGPQVWLRVCDSIVTLKDFWWRYYQGTPLLLLTLWYSSLKIKVWYYGISLLQYLEIWYVILNDVFKVSKMPYVPILTVKFLSMVSKVWINQNPSKVRVSVTARLINKNAVEETSRSLHMTSIVILKY